MSVKTNGNTPCLNCFLWSYGVGPIKFISAIFFFYYNIINMYLNELLNYIKCLYLVIIDYYLSSKLGKTF